MRVGPAGRLAALARAKRNLAPGTRPQRYLKILLEYHGAQHSMDSVPIPSRKNVHSSCPQSTHEEALCALPIQCWQGFSEPHHNGNVRLFRDGDLSPEQHDAPSANFAKWGERHTLVLQRVYVYFARDGPRCVRKLGAACRECERIFVGTAVRTVVKT